VAHGIYALYAGALFGGLEAKRRPHVDVVADGDGVLFEVLLGPRLDDQVARLHGHCEATKLDCGCVHVFEVNVCWKLVPSPTPVGGAVHVEGIRRDSVRINGNNHKCAQLIGAYSVSETNVVRRQLLTDGSAKAVGAQASKELLLGATAGQGDCHVCVCAANDCVVRARLVPVFDQINKGFTDDENHAFIVA